MHNCATVAKRAYATGILRRAHPAKLHRQHSGATCQPTVQVWVEQTELGVGCHFARAQPKRKFDPALREAVVQIGMQRKLPIAGGRRGAKAAPMPRRDQPKPSCRLAPSQLPACAPSAT